MSPRLRRSRPDLRLISIVLLTCLGTCACAGSGLPAATPPDTLAGAGASASAASTGVTAVGWSAAPEWVRQAVTGPAAATLASASASVPASVWVDDRVAVVGSVPDPVARQIAVDASEAVAVVTPRWPHPWPRRLVVLAPRDAAELARMAGVPLSQLGKAAAMTIHAPTTTTTTTTTTSSSTTSSAARSGPTPSPSPAGTTPTRSSVSVPESPRAMPPAAAERPQETRGAQGPSTVLGAQESTVTAYVLLDPRSWQQASTLGRRALLIHEAVHIAVAALPRPGTARPPAWLLEGHAQLIAYDHLGVDVRTVAQPSLRRIARSGLPTHLPSAAELDADDPARTDAYALSWLACRTLARLAGPDAVDRAVATGSLATTGVRPAELLTAWRADLRSEIARSG